MRNGMDVYYRYRAHSDFAYVTGCTDQPGAAAVLDTETGQLTLLLPPQPEAAAFWSGPQPSHDELAALYGADRVCHTTDLGPVLRQLSRGRDVHVTSSGHTDKLAHLLGQENGAADAGGASAPRVLDSLLPAVLHRARSVKTVGELACLLEANRISGRAHMDAWRTTRPGMLEYQVEAAFTGSCLAAGSTGLGYPCIAGAGRNAAILHYDTNRAVIGSQDLVLMDAGAEFRCYTADITRTFPANGRFTSHQRDIYNAVLECQELALSMLGATGPASDSTACAAATAPSSHGVACSLQDADAAVRRHLLTALQGLGLVSQAASLDALLAAKIDRVFMPHGLGHWLGLDVHDVGPEGPVPKSALHAGHVITVEPGLYFIDTLLKKAAADPTQCALLNMAAVDAYKHVGGVRIEDNIAFMPTQQTGARPQLLNLTMMAGVPKTVSLIEAAIEAGRR